MDFNNSEKNCQCLGVIYKITNNLNGKQYVGQTINFKSRIRHHKRCKTSMIGQAIQKYGWENFSVEILEECESREKLNEREIFWIAKLNCMKPDGYNLTGGGETNKKVADEVRKKLSDYNKARGIKPPPRTGKKPWNKGKKLSDEHRAKLSESHLGQPAYWKGKNIPEEVRAKVSAGLKKYYSEHPEAKKYLAEINKGKKHSEEEKAKISATLKARNAAKKKLEENKFIEGSLF